MSQPFFAMTSMPKVPLGRTFRVDRKPRESKNTSSGRGFAKERRSSTPKTSRQSERKFTMSTFDVGSVLFLVKRIMSFMVVGGTLLKRMRQTSIFKFVHSWFFYSILLSFYSVFVVICTYMGLFVSIKRTRGQTPLANPNDMDFVLRFFFIVLTNIMCWAPVYVLRLLVLLKYPVPG